jgi:hypothetical protein
MEKTGKKCLKGQGPVQKNSSQLETFVHYYPWPK